MPRALQAVFLVSIASLAATASAVQAVPPTPTNTPTPTPSQLAVRVGSATGEPGDVVRIDVTLDTAGFAVVGLQNDIYFPVRFTALERCVVNPDIGKGLTAFAPAATSVRALVAGYNLTPIPDGAVLYSCTFKIAANAPGGTYRLQNSRVIVSSPQGNALPAVGVDGAITVPGGPPPFLTPTPRGPAIVLSRVEATRGGHAVLTATLETLGAAVAGTQNDLSVGTGVRIAATPDGRPDCAVNPAINKAASSFAFVPAACDATSCTVRALILSVDNVDLIPDNAPLYTCTLDIAADAVGQYPVHISNIIMSDPAGVQIPNTTGTDGFVFIPAPVPPSISLDVPPAGPGEQITVGAVLDAPDASIAGTQNDITFDPLRAPIAATATGRPDCAVNAAIDKEATSFAFLPAGCSGVACTGVRAIVFSTANVDPIPDGATLYTCTVTVTADTASGRYPLTISGAIYSDPNGGRVDGVPGADTGVQVHAPPAAGTPLEGASPTAAPTASPRGAAATATATPTPRQPGSDDGCRMQPANDDGLWLPSVAALAALARRRRRRRIVRVLPTRRGAW